MTIWQIYWLLTIWVQNVPTWYTCQTYWVLALVNGGKAINLPSHRKSLQWFPLLAAGMASGHTKVLHQSLLSIKRATGYPKIHLEKPSNWPVCMSIYIHSIMDTATYISFRMQLNKKLSAPETQLPYLGPWERVDADQVLEDKNSHVSDRQMKCHTFMILHANSTDNNPQRNRKLLEPTWMTLTHLSTSYR